MTFCDNLFNTFSDNNKPDYSYCNKMSLKITYESTETQPPSSHQFSIQFQDVT